VNGRPAPRRLFVLLLVVEALLPGCEASQPACDGGVCDRAAPTATGDAATPPPIRVVDEDAACAMQSTEASAGLDKQVDVLFVIDNSGSMGEEIAAIRRNIDQSFARIVEESRVDYRVLVLSAFGTEGTSVCIEPPLAGAPCADGLYATNGDRFFHYHLPIDSFDPWCKLLSALDRPDPNGRAPGGLKAWLRPDAEKVIVAITDDSPSCTYQGGGESQPVVFGAPGADPYEDALLFHQTLLAAAPEQLGVAPDARYAFYAFVGLSPHADATAPWFPHEPLQAELCDTAASPGLGYQALSVITDALRYPVCEGRGFDAVLRVLARSVVESAKAECSFQLPAPPRGQFLNKDTIHVEYRPRGDGEAVDIRQVAEEGRCDDHAFLLRGDRIELCRQACAIVEADRAAALRVLYGCLVDVE
jgi:hypothetical protein